MADATATKIQVANNEAFMVVILCKLVGGGMKLINV